MKTNRSKGAIRFQSPWPRARGPYHARRISTLRVAQNLGGLGADRSETRGGPDRRPRLRSPHASERVGHASRTRGCGRGDRFAYPPRDGSLRSSSPRSSRGNRARARVASQPQDGPRGRSIRSHGAAHREGTPGVRTKSRGREGRALPRRSERSGMSSSLWAWGSSTMGARSGAGGFGSWRKAQSRGANRGDPRRGSGVDRPKDWAPRSTSPPAPSFAPTSLPVRRVKSIAGPLE